MEDLLGIGKILDSKTVQKAWEDMLSKPAQEVGDGLTDIVKTARLLAFPFILGRASFDRLKAWADMIAYRVPEERQVPVPSHIAGPALRNLVFIEDDNILKELYLNLLTAAADKDQRGKAHPAFVNVIEQLSPDEAIILYEIQEDFYFATTAPGSAHSNPYIGCSANGYPLDKLEYPKEWDMYCDHLESLNLVKVVKVSGNGHTMVDGVGVTSFGRWFIEVCVPNKDEFETHRKTP